MSERTIYYFQRGKDLNLLAKAFLELMKKRGSIKARRVILIDPDDPQERNIYEDIDQETPDDQFNALVTLEPGASKAVGNKTESWREIVTHEKALSDIFRMLDLGYVVHEISRDLDFRD